MNSFALNIPSRVRLLVYGITGVTPSSISNFAIVGVFYSYASKGTLAASQIWFNKEHPYDLAVRKIKHLNSLASLVSSENFMLEEITTVTKRYKFCTTDLNFSLCMNKEIDAFGNEKGDCYVVESLRDEDCFTKSKNAYVITHIFSKSNDVKKYTNLLFLDDSATVSTLPENIKSLLVPDLLENLYIKA